MARAKAPAKGSRISRNEAETFYVLYNQYGSYKAVAKATGRSDTAVAKWVKILKAEKGEAI